MINVCMRLNKLNLDHFKLFTERTLERMFGCY